MAKETGLMSWKDLAPGIAILTPGNASALKTGDWRSAHPVTDYSRCVKCGNCYIFCPEPAYTKNAEGFYEVDLYHCKGCGICAAECPVTCIDMVQEGE